MTDPVGPHAELEAAIALVIKHRPASLLLRLTADRAGQIRVRLEGGVERPPARGKAGRPTA